MQLYVMKCDTTSKENVISEIKLLGGEIRFVSPVLPVISAELNEKQKKEIEKRFEFSCFIEDPVGKLQDITGDLSKNKKKKSSPNPVIIIPALKLQMLRNLDMIGWGTTIAVLDSGINEKWVSEKFDYTGFGSTPAIDHGSQVGNIIRQIAPGAIISSFKVTNDGKVSYTNTLKAVSDAVKKANIINMSLGFNIDDCSPQNPCVLCETINHYTVAEKKLFIAAAGNEGKENSIQCPGSSQEAITVGAVKRDLAKIADYSSKGAPGDQKPNIVATGVINFKSRFIDGTSFSTPIVTGVAASIFSGMKKDISATKTLLYSTAKDLGLPKHHQGFGLLDIVKIVEVLENDKSNSESEGQESN